MSPQILVLALTLAAATHRAQGQDPPAPAPPNVVVIFTDDQGYGDLTFYGHPTIHTPRIDALAAGGIKLTQFYVASPVCSPSRAALLTGCYPKRVGMHRHVVFPADNHGLHTDEETIADLLKARGYATGCFGKWHLGHRPGHLPTDQGFDVYAGVPYSNDMSQMHRKEGSKYRFRLPWIEGTEVVEWEPDQHLLTERQTAAAVAFIDENAKGPFFVYVPFSMPHIPIYASEDFEGNSPRGLYGDVIEEIDAGVGRIVDALRRNGVLEDTVILFASDNGPWLQFGANGGSAGLLRGGKGTNWEGGQRVPCIVHWPARIAAGSVCRDVVTALDVLPTIVALTGARPPERVIDGRDVSRLLAGESPLTDTEPVFVYYTSRGKLAGLRRGPWKLLLDGDQLFQVEQDVSEARDVAKAHPDLVAELRALAEEFDAAIERDARPELRVERHYFDPRRR